MSVELAAAYVSLTVTAKGIASDINRELGGPLQSAAEASGQKSGAGFKGGFGGALQTLKTDMAGAEGLFGKLGAAGTSAGSMLSANAAPAALAAGAAFVAFASKSVAAFQETALEAGKFAAATGVTVEQASRLREVASDYGISADAIQGTLLRFNKSAEDAAPALKELGAELVRTKDGNVDSYESFINAATAIGKIADPTKRAQAAQEVFGRSYSQIAELMELDAGELRAALEGVSGAKVINEEELKQAREFRDAIANLKDIGEDFMTSVGQGLVPILTDIANALVAVNDAAENILGDGAFGKLLKGAFDLSPLGQLVDLVNKLDEAFTPELEGKVSETAFATTAVGDAATGAKDGLDGLSPAAENYAKVTFNAAAAAREMAAEVKYADERIRELKTGIQADSALLTLQGQFDDVKAKAEAAWIATATGAADAEAVNREYQLSLNGLKLGVIDYADEVLKLPASQVTAISAAIDQGSLDGAESILTNAARPRTVKFNITGDAVDFRVIPGVSSARAKGGPTAPFSTYLVGEEGPELITMGAQSAYVTPAPNTAQALSSAGSRNEGGGDFIIQNNRRDITVDELSRAVQMARLR